MAKSKSGGTRAYLRGKIGADVYSIGKTAKGKKQQVVRSLAEVVSNPQTAAQMKGRAIMSTVMQMVHVLSPIIDHSFDGVSNGQPSISEFIARNYALVKADVAANPSEFNEFGIVNYGSKVAQAGSYVVSVGKAANPDGIIYPADSANDAIEMSAATVADLRKAFGLDAEGYLTLLQLLKDATTGAVTLGYCRIHLSQSEAGSTVITSDNVASLFSFDTNLVPTVTFTAGSDGAAGTVKIAVPEGSSLAYAWIVTDKSAGEFIHSSEVFTVRENVSLNPFDTAIDTYPIGTERFLNGGDI